MCFSYNFVFQFNFSYLIFLQECLIQTDYYYLNGRPQRICSKRIGADWRKSIPKASNSAFFSWCSSHSARLRYLWMLLHHLLLTGCSTPASQVGTNCELFYSTRAASEECAVHKPVKAANGRGYSIPEVAVTDDLILCLPTCLLLSRCKC